MNVPAYTQPVAGGDWEHRGGDCKVHGNNIAFAKPYKSVQPYLCVQCMLEYARSLAVMESLGVSKE
jgi:hypothetical protein